MSEAPGATAPTLVRGLGATDGALLTIGSIIGTGIFLSAGDVARAVPDPSLVLAVWLAGGLLTLAGALTYAELGAMMPRAGGLYVYLAEAWGPAVGFLYGWACLIAIMTGGIAAIAVGFGEYFGALVPLFSGTRAWWTVNAGPIHWTVSGAQAAAAIAIVVLTAVNHFGLSAGARTQNALTALKLGAILALVAFGLLAARAVGGEPVARVAASPALGAAFLTAMIAALWTYDGWYALTFSAGEMRDARRDLPRALTWGVAAVVVVYLLLNAVYLRALSPQELAATPRAAEAAATKLLGAGASVWITLAIVISSFGCLAATILYASRIYQPMAQDGLFFRGVARIHPHWRAPVASLWLQSAWAVALALSGTYLQLVTYVTFAGILSHVLGGLAVFRLRATRPDAPRPYRAWGFPVVPGLFVLALLALVVNTLQAAPRESLLGLVAIALGLPAYAAFRARSRLPARPT